MSGSYFVGNVMDNELVHSVDMMEGLMAMSAVSAPSLSLSGLPWVRKAAQDAQEAVGTVLKGEQPALPKAATGRLLEEVERLAQRHIAELLACVEALLPELDRGRLLVQPGSVTAGTGGDLGLQLAGHDRQQPAELRAPSLDPLERAAAAAASERLLLPGQTTTGDCEVRTGSQGCSEAQNSGSLVEGETSRRQSKFSESSNTKKKRRKAMDRLASPGKIADTSQSLLQRINGSRAYEWSSGVFVLLNAFFVGFQTEYMARRAQSEAALGQQLSIEEPAGFIVFEVLFCMGFIIDLAVRWACDGLFGFFRTSETSSNVLDCVVVAFCCLDMVLTLVVAQGIDSASSNIVKNVSVLRVIRVVRIVRVARIIRVMTFFRELRMMIYSILKSWKSLAWVICVFLLTFYIFGIVFTAATTSYLIDTEMWFAEENQAVKRYFGTLQNSVLNLFMAMSGGHDWGDYYEAMNVLPAHYSILFLMFIAFCVFAVVNIVTGVFVDSAMLSNRTDRAIVVHEELETKKQFLLTLREVFEEMDEDGTGSLTLEEFESRLDDERVVAYFNALKLDVTDARTLFKLLDIDNSNEVSIEEFLTGCYRLQGEPRSLDMKIMQCQVRHIQKSVERLSVVIKDVHSKLHLRHTNPRHLE